MSDVEVKKGKVIWPGKGSNRGYQSGLELLEEQIPQFFKKGDGKVYWFCRDVGIAKINPGAEQRDIVNFGKQLVSDRVLTQEQLDYIYSQFEFDVDSYHPPKWMKSG